MPLLEIATLISLLWLIALYIFDDEQSKPNNNEDPK